MLLWTKPSTLIQLSNSYYSLFEGNFKKVSLFKSAKNKIKIFSEKNVKYIRNTLKNNWLNSEYSIKTGTTSEFKEHYLIAMNNTFIISIWMWNKDWSKTKKDIYSIEKWKWLFEIISKYY